MWLAEVVHCGDCIITCNVDLTAFSETVASNSKRRPRRFAMMTVASHTQNKRGPAWRGGCIRMLDIPQLMWVRKPTQNFAHTVLIAKAYKDYERDLSSAMSSQVCKVSTSIVDVRFASKVHHTNQTVRKDHHKQAHLYTPYIPLQGIPKIGYRAPQCLLPFCLFGVGGNGTCGSCESIPPRRPAEQSFSCQPPVKRILYLYVNYVRIYCSILYNLYNTVSLHSVYYSII